MAQTGARPISYSEARLLGVYRTMPEHQREAILDLIIAFAPKPSTDAEKCGTVIQLSEVR